MTTMLILFAFVLGFVFCVLCFRWNAKAEENDTITRLRCDLENSHKNFDQIYSENEFHKHLLDKYKNGGVHA